MAGALMQGLFRMKFKQMLDDMKKILEKEVERGRNI